ncbi:MAG: hypothetical protein ACR2HN_08955 [Tepidiformaceae bacterium]
MANRGALGPLAAWAKDFCASVDRLRTKMRDQGPAASLPFPERKAAGLARFDVEIATMADAQRALSSLQPPEEARPFQEAFVGALATVEGEFRAEKSAFGAARSVEDIDVSNDRIAAAVSEIEQQFGEATIALSPQIRATLAQQTRCGGFTPIPITP